MITTPVDRRFSLKFFLCWRFLLVVAPAPLSFRSMWCFFSLSPSSLLSSWRVADSSGPSLSSFTLNRFSQLFTDSESPFPDSNLLASLRAAVATGLAELLTLTDTLLLLTVSLASAESFVSKPLFRLSFLSRLASNLSFLNLLVNRSVSVAILQEPTGLG